MSYKLGPAGKLARFFIDSKLTPLVIIASILLGIAAVVALPREEEPQIVQKIRDANAQLLLVAFGVPNQELWLSRWISETGVAAGLGVGGLFDFYSGRISRAPQWRVT